MGDQYILICSGGIYITNGLQDVWKSSLDKEIWNVAEDQISHHFATGQNLILLRKCFFRLFKILSEKESYKILFLENENKKNNIQKYFYVSYGQFTFIQYANFQQLSMLDKLNNNISLFISALQFQLVEVNISIY